MIGFLIKKAFFDSWDNMIRLVLFNIGFLLVLFLMITLPFLGNNSSLAQAVLLGIPGFILFFLYLGFLSPMLKEMSDYKTPDIRECLSLFRKNFKALLVFAGGNGTAVLILLIPLPFYMRMGGVFGYLGGSIMLWTLFFWCGSIQYYLPLLTRLGGGPRKALKKSFLLFLDNPGFSVFLLVWSLLTMILSILTAFLLPGFASVLLFHQDSLKLRLYKYDYLTETEGRGKTAIPWDSLLEEDRKSLGPRSLKGMIFLGRIEGVPSYFTRAPIDGGVIYMVSLDNFSKLREFPS